ncbi:MAG: lysophospholipid acyltransferase family protein [Bacteroidaceae bacterium]|nr:lysophospholipid acyltransferase family protein [Bacteroidaceae bacterium]
MIKKISFFLTYGIIKILSLIPLCLMHLLSDILTILCFIIPPLRYRKKVVQKNLRASFPEKSKKELRILEFNFYRFFFDMAFESIKACSMSARWMKRHIEFVGLEHFYKQFEQGRSVMAYMGHTGNWEWVSTLPTQLKPQYIVSQVYHVLENETMNSVILKIREAYGSVSIPMERTLRQLLTFKQEGKQFVVGMIADQVPLMRNIHYWSQFMNQKTPFFTGAERIAKKLDLAIIYAEVVRVKRGYYQCIMHPMFESTENLPEFAITEEYIRRLEKTIQNDPAVWLWSHNRWKRTWEGYQKYLKYMKEKHQRASKSS